MLTFLIKATILLLIKINRFPFSYRIILYPFKFHHVPYQIIIAIENENGIFLYIEACFEAIKTSRPVIIGWSRKLNMPSDIYKNIKTCSLYIYCYNEAEEVIYP